VGAVEFSTYTWLGKWNSNSYSMGAVFQVLAGVWAEIINKLPASYAMPISLRILNSQFWEVNFHQTFNNSVIIAINLL
jgi:hypothetical protein